MHIISKKYSAFFHIIHEEFEGALVPLGAYGGAGSLNGWNLPTIMVSLAKGRGLFTSRYWGIMGQKQPS